MKQKRILFSLILCIILAVVLASCPSETEMQTDTGRFVHTNQELTLVDTTATTAYSDTAASKNAKTLNAAPGNTVITEKAVVSSPQTSDGTVLQASDVCIGPNGKYAFVTYMLQGESNSGMLDIIDVSNTAWPELLYSIDFSKTDLSAAAYDGSYIYIGGQSLENTVTGKYAYIRALKFTGNKPDTSSTALELHLPGYFTTDIAADGSLVYVTTGTENSDGTLGAGLFIFSFDGSSFTQVAHIQLSDARSVAVSSSGEFAVFEAKSSLHNTQSTVHLYTYSGGLTEKSTLAVEADILDQSKAGLAFIGSYLMLAANRSGVKVINNGTNLVTIPAPALTTLSPDLQPSNTVSDGFANSKKIYFISNGEAGLWVGDADNITASSYGLSGSIRFSGGVSVNDVAAKNSTVVAATGTGGVHILELASPASR
ncbi:MAG TPA: hypothetical protein DCL73_01730 [Treponema sp.]|nr:hypothetical protein [Treponema sp.]